MITESLKWWVVFIKEHFRRQLQNDDHVWHQWLSTRSSTSIAVSIVVHLKDEEPGALDVYASRVDQDFTSKPQDDKYFLLEKMVMASYHGYAAKLMQETLWNL